MIKRGKDLLPGIREKVESGALKGLIQTNEEIVGDDYWTKTFQNVIKAFKMYPQFFLIATYNITTLQMKWLNQIILNLLEVLMY